MNNSVWIKIPQLLRDGFVVTFYQELGCDYLKLSRDDFHFCSVLQKDDDIAQVLKYCRDAWQDASEDVLIELDRVRELKPVGDKGLTLPEALKTNLPLQRPGKGFNGRISWSGESTSQITPGWIDPVYLLQVVNLTKEDICADDWEVKRS